ncbi:MAG: Fic family protein, partial [Promicromonosporaceae bacterium]|nr:Fic family protein [Promicromonosporaceae bacterium]
MIVPIQVPAHDTMIEPWQQTARGGSMADRMLAEIPVSIPPLIAGIDVETPSALVAEMEDAIREIASVDQTHGQQLAPLAAMLLRVESVASSKIESVEASVDDFARALHGIKSNPSATSMVAATRALSSFISGLSGGNGITFDSLLSAHETLMMNDEQESAYAGRFRDMQNWIGGSDYSPRGALFVPPPARMVEPLVTDLLQFANRSDLPVILQGAIAHAQFESIHPFTDGNGRIGRSLINAIFRRRRITRRTVVPIASALVARRDDYFATLTAYRAGDIEPL